MTSHRLSHAAALWAAAAALAVSMAFSAAPTPLYILYQEKWGFSTFTVTVIYAIYAAGVIAGLVLCGHISDWYGRRPVLLAGLSLNLACDVAFLLEPPLVGLLAARFVCGIAIGLTTATATAYIAELHSISSNVANHRSDVRAGPTAATITTIATVGGIGLGPLIAGALAQFAPAPLQLPYATFGVQIVMSLAFVALSPETVRRPHPMPSYRMQRVAVPARQRRRFLAASVLGFAAFSVYGVIASLVPTFLTTSFNQHSHATAGGTAFVAFAAGASIQVALERTGPRAGTHLGPLLMVSGLALVTAGLSLPSLTLFVFGAAVSGAGSGALFRHGIGVAAVAAPANAKAEVLAGFFVATYLGVSVPALAMGAALQFWATHLVMTFFATAVTVAVLLSLMVLRRTREPAYSQRKTTVRE